MKVRVGDLTKIRTGKLDANASSETGEYPFFTCSKEPLKISTYSYDCECVLVAGNGDLNVKYYNGKFDAYQRTYIIEDNSSGKICMLYLYYYMESYIEELRKQSIGGVIKYIKLGNLTDALIELPSVYEQKAIVEILGKIKNIINKHNKEISNLDELIKARFVEVFGDPIKNDKSWKQVKLMDLGLLARGISKHRPRNAVELLGGPYPLVQTGEVANADTYITSYLSTYSELGLKQSKMWPKGTLCITIAANIAQTSILTFDACFPDSVVGFIAGERVETVFVHYWFSFLQSSLEALATQVAQKNLNLKTLSNVEVIVPPIQLQSEFVNFTKQVDKSKFINKG